MGKGAGPLRETLEGGGGQREREKGGLPPKLGGAPFRVSPPLALAAWA